MTYRIKWYEHWNNSENKQPILINAASKEEAIRKFPDVVPFGVITSIEELPDESTVLKVEFEDHYSHYTAAFDHMIAQGVKHIGWLNSGITPPEGDYQKVYSNRSGSSCLYCDPVTRIAYSVDMGD